MLQFRLKADDYLRMVNMSDDNLILNKCTRNLSIARPEKRISVHNINCFHISIMFNIVHFAIISHHLYICVSLEQETGLLFRTV